MAQLPYFQWKAVNANSSTASGIVDADRQPIIEHSEVYSGVYGRASINFYAFNSNGNKGIACGLWCTEFSSYNRQTHTKLLTLECLGLLTFWNRSKKPGHLFITRRPESQNVTSYLNGHIEFCTRELIHKMIDAKCDTTYNIVRGIQNVKVG